MSAFDMTHEQITAFYAHHDRCELRDRFAQAALIGILSGQQLVVHESAIESIVSWSYRLADAMLDHRDANPLTDPPPGSEH